MTKRTASALKGVQNPNFDEILPFVLKDTHPQDIDINVCFPVLKFSFTMLMLTLFCNRLASMMIDTHHLA